MKSVFIKIRASTLAAPLALALAAALSSCVLINIDGITSSGVQETKTYTEYKGITAIEATDAVDITIVKGSTDSVEVTMSDNLFEYFKMSLSGSTLNVGGFTKTVCGSSKPVVKVTVTGDVSSLSANNASTASLSGMSPSTLSVTSNNASTVTVSSSSCGSFSLTASNASKASLSGLTATGDSSLSVSDASEASVYCDGNISGDVTAASTLTWSGNGSWRGTSSGASTVRYQ